MRNQEATVRLWDCEKGNETMWHTVRVERSEVSKAVYISWTMSSSWFMQESLARKPALQDVQNEN